MTRFNSKHGVTLWQRGHHVKDERPAKPSKPRRTSKVIDTAALEAAKAQLAETAVAVANRERVPPSSSNTLPAIGRCHECDRPVSGERRYCGPCLARRA